MISTKLYDFLSRFYEKNLGKRLSFDGLRQETTLEEIGIEDLDLDLLMAEFIKEFEIDDSKFESKRYFGLGIPLVDNNVNNIKKIIGEFCWMPLAKEERMPFTLGVLELALERGILL